VRGGLYASETWPLQVSFFQNSHFPKFPQVPLCDTVSNTRVGGQWSSASVFTKGCRWLYPGVHDWFPTKTTRASNPFIHMGSWLKAFLRKSARTAVIRLTRTSHQRPRLSKHDPPFSAGVFNRIISPALPLSLGAYGTTEHRTWGALHSNAICMTHIWCGGLHSWFRESGPKLLVKPQRVWELSENPSNRQGAIDFFLRLCRRFILHARARGSRTFLWQTRFESSSFFRLNSGNFSAFSALTQFIGRCDLIWPINYNLT
jgi:hypothetical protein